MKEFFVAFFTGFFMFIFLVAIVVGSFSLPFYIYKTFGALPGFICLTLEMAVGMGLANYEDRNSPI